MSDNEIPLPVAYTHIRIQVYLLNALNVFDPAGLFQQSIERPIDQSITQQYYPPTCATVTIGPDPAIFIDSLVTGHVFFQEDARFTLFFASPQQWQQRLKLEIANGPYGVFSTFSWVQADTPYSSRGIPGQFDLAQSTGTHVHGSARRGLEMRFLKNIKGWVEDAVDAARDLHHRLRESHRQRKAEKARWARAKACAARSPLVFYDYDSNSDHQSRVDQEAAGSLYHRGDDQQPAQSGNEEGQLHRAVPVEPEERQDAEIQTGQQLEQPVTRHGDMSEGQQNGQVSASQQEEQLAIGHQEAPEPQRKGQSSVGRRQEQRTRDHSGPRDEQNGHSPGLPASRKLYDHQAGIETRLHSQRQAAEQAGRNRSTEIPQLRIPVQSSASLAAGRSGPPSPLKTPEARTTEKEAEEGYLRFA
ncbi:unnamed protein product [Diplocarpon coronariae]